MEKQESNYKRRLSENCMMIIFIAAGRLIDYKKNKKLDKLISKNTYDSYLAFCF